MSIIAHIINIRPNVREDRSPLLARDTCSWRFSRPFQNKGANRPLLVEKLKEKAKSGFPLIIAFAGGQEKELPARRNKT